MVNYGTSPFLNPYLFQPQVQVNTPQSGFIDVQSESEARTYPVEPGKSVAFKNTSEEDVYYKKTAGKTALDAPDFKKFRLVEEELPAESPQATEPASTVKDIDLSAYATKTEMTALYERLDTLQDEIKELRKEWEG